MTYTKLKVLRTNESETIKFDIKKIEQGKKLPLSYINFINKFGYGRTLGLLLIYPSYEGFCDSLGQQTIRIKNFINEAIVEDFLEFEPDGTPEIAKRLFPFAMSENGEYFAWDINCDTEEYPIYCIATRMGGIKYVSKDLYELIDLLSSDKIKNVMGTGYKALPKTFEPF